MTLDMSLNSKDIVGVIGQLKRVQNSLPAMCNEFVSRLIDAGIETAEQNCGEYGKYILFSKKLSPSKYGCKGILVATNKTQVVREWKYKGGMRTALISPILMAEFGSGWEAANNRNVIDVPEGVGQGTFPAQTHAYDPHGWYWTDMSGKHHHSKGEAPTYPMHAASVEMIIAINEIGQEVFNLG